MAKKKQQSSREAVRYAELRPEQFRARLEQMPVAYLPLGTLEWHGEHLPLGTDAIVSEGLMVRAAQQYGGIVLPPLFLGPDRMRPRADGSYLVGMDYDESVDPPRPLAGSAYWVSDELFEAMVSGTLNQLARAGFRGVFADGHGPSRELWVRRVTEGAPHTAGYADLTLMGVTEAYAGQWTSQTGHAAENETSLMRYYRDDLVDMDMLKSDEGRTGISGEDPSKASQNKGKQHADTALQVLGTILADHGFTA
jgi:creatinine amidohydrolase